MMAWFIERDGSLLGPSGWSPDVRHAMRFSDQASAAAAIEAMRRDTPKLLVGAQAASRECADNPMLAAAQVEHEYDPFGLRRPRPEPRVAG